MIADAHLNGILTLWHENAESTVCTLEGNCMAPLLNDGDSILVRHGGCKLRVGDVVVVGAPGEFRVRRVLGIRGRRAARKFLLKSDQEARFWPDVPPHRILGKVMEVRGPQGCLRLDSFGCRVLNRTLALRSYVSGRRFTDDTLFWKGVNILFAARERLVPTKRSISLLPLRAFCRLQRRCGGPGRS
jgi:hypothetical protein